LSASVGSAGQDSEVRFGPLAEEFPLTLRTGQRGEAMGPLFHWQETPEAWLGIFALGILPARTGR